MIPTWQNGMDKLLQVVPKFELEPQKTALMIIDMQYAAAHPDYQLGPYLKEKNPRMYSYYFDRLAQIVVPNHIKLLDFFRKNGLRVIYFKVGSLLPDLSDLPALRRGRPGGAKSLSAESFAYNVLEEIKPQKGELVMHKSSSGGFNSSGIDQVLRNFGVECLVVTGVVTYACVLMTALDAADRGYKTVIVEDAAAALDQDHHDAALRIFASILGRVASTDEVCAELKKGIS